MMGRAHVEGSLVTRTWHAFSFFTTRTSGAPTFGDRGSKGDIIVDAEEAPSIHTYHSPTTRDTEIQASEAEMKKSPDHPRAP